ncbi:MAG TPA: VIT1/CCC1 transporter family protein [Candidatus Limnocylindrales bacterium]|jgi:VIT1/CCC1 family predicted Fe2+/Mn2+ transporter
MAATVTDPVRSLENLKLERDAISLYQALARIERDERRSAAFDHIAANERRHAEIWATRLRDLGVDVPPPGPPRMRIRFIVLLARLFGTRAVSDLVQALEGDEEELYVAQADPDVESIVADEREHAEIWKRLDAGGVAVEARRTARAARTPSEIGLAERWHRNAQSGTLRAMIFGVSDGLVSNLSLVMGVAGAAGATAGEPRFVLLAGIAGLLAGSFSMAAGEYISMQSQRELFERQIELERAELEALPEEEEAELATVFRAKGFTQAEAARIAHRLIADPETALDTLVREELGLDPDELGSPWGAATASFLAFAAGAAIPVVPYLVGTGGVAFAATIGLSLIALFAVGAGVSLLTGRSTLYSGIRQVGIGAAAATITFLVGNLLGVTVA